MKKCMVCKIKDFARFIKGIRAVVVVSDGLWSKGYRPQSDGAGGVQLYRGARKLKKKEENEIN